MFSIKEHWWRMQRLIEQAVLRNSDPSEEEHVFWRKRLFRNVISYGFVISIVAFVSSVTFGFFAGNTIVQWFNVVFVFALLSIIFNKKIMIHTRKILALFLLYVLAIIYIAVLGSEGPGVLYLIIITIFSAMIFPRPAAYWLVGLNVLICAGFGAVIQYKLFESPLLQSYDLPLWASYSGNLIFVSLISVMLISKVLNGLEQTIKKEASLISRLDASERYFRNTFEANPVPMYVFDMENGKFLHANDAACNKYGYTKEEFLQMNIVDIRPQSESSKLMDLTSMIKNRDYSGILIHINKNKEVFPVEIETNTIRFEEREARLVLATDVSERINYIQKIERQNKDLKEIAWIQSHMVRAPLANIMSLTEFLIKYPGEDTQQTLNFLNDSSQKLNMAIESIVGQAGGSGLTS
ncbi:PAS domain S-box-containing protein [Pedobacter cryoconitis]|uniref:PAS domain S-box-containing protein n=1 Tax=Pedobacter cryoconitis TaxID=188932 RepID=A0A7W9DKK0_9SPHI|nr:PAS domain S-box protein [Pedobacter cryoconitis]MBB5622311.1 PAS domain S-box-containing protein [Pedobacter cryoconitis]MBB5647465.1 PAS domain S-box-containing protein [Pedobacter cryoconitis]